MTGVGKTWLDVLMPDLPEGIREDFFVDAAREVQRHAPWLFAAMLVNSLIALLTGAEQAHWVVRFVLPGVMAAYCLISIIALRQDFGFVGKPWKARRFLLNASISSCFGAAVCTAWCVLSWLAAPVEARMHFPVILTMGGLATAYVLGNSRVGAYANLAIDFVPMALLMIFLGTPAEAAAGISLVMAGVFQIVMIQSRHSRMIDLLLLQQRARIQADTDPLTGLANRRALLSRAQTGIARGEDMRLMLVDIDNFKAINDQFGHDSGDAVLCELSELIAAHAPPGTLPARIGGEEFALLGTMDSLPQVCALALLSEVRTAPMPHGKQVTVSIGIAEGRLASDDDWARLFAAADSALYHAKRTGRNRIVSEPEDAGEPGEPVVSTAA